MDVIERAEDEGRLIKNSIRYLDSLTHTKGLDVPTLKSLYRTKCRLMELRRHVFLPQQKPYQRCQRCFMNFSEGNTKREVLPMKLSNFAKKIIAKEKKGVVLTKYQRKYYNELLRKFPNGFDKQNKLVLTCSYCQKEQELWMKKPKPERLPLRNTAGPTPKKKKTKKKDKFCGLNASFVSLSSSKKKKKSKKSSDVNHNSTTDTLQIQECDLSESFVSLSSSKKEKDDRLSFNNTNVFVVPEKSNPNSSVSMTDARVFQTSDFIPLESNAKKKQTIKFSKKQKEPKKLVLEGVSKAKEKLQKKKLNNLSNILKQANENKGKPTSRLKQFLSSL